MRRLEFWTVRDGEQAKRLWNRPKPGFWFRAFELRLPLWMRELSMVVHNLEEVAP